MDRQANRQLLYQYHALYSCAMLMCNKNLHVLIKLEHECIHVADFLTTSLEICDLAKDTTK